MIAACLLIDNAFFAVSAYDKRDQYHFIIAVCFLVYWFVYWSLYFLREKYVDDACEDL